MCCRQKSRWQMAAIDRFVEDYRMNQIDRNKILRMLCLIALVFAVVGVFSHIHRKNSMTLQDYAEQYPEQAQGRAETAEDGSDAGDKSTAEDRSDAGDKSTAEDRSDAKNEASAKDGSDADLQEQDRDAGEDSASTVSSLTGALLNGGADGQAMLEQRVSYVPKGMKTPVKDFYYEPLSRNLCRYITGISYPADAESSELAVTYDDLRYVHILHYNFDGLPVEGELICNAAIAQDLMEIFYELYRSEYQIEKVLLIDEYSGDDNASMEDNNTSCFNYRVVEGSASLSKHALGLALDINPLYNPYIAYGGDGSRKVSPASAESYADRDAIFPYKIDEDDLCYKLFTEHGFIWGGNWNSVKDYQHFQKTLN